MGLSELLKQKDTKLEEDTSNRELRGVRREELGMGEYIKTTFAEN